jgi:hypothetical protein
MDAKYRPSAEEKLGISVISYVHETTTASILVSPSRLIYISFNPFVL